MGKVGDLHLSSVVEVGIGDDGGVGGKEPEVDGDISSRHVGGRVGFVFLLIKDTSAIGDVENIVGLSKSVESSVPTYQPLNSLSRRKGAYELIGRYPVSQELE